MKNSPGLPQIGSFQSLLWTIVPGEPVWLIWQAPNATLVELKVAGQLPLNVTKPGGSVCLYLKVTTTYTLVASNPLGTVESYPVTVEVLDIHLSINPKVAEMFTGDTFRFGFSLFGTPTNALNWTATGGSFAPCGLYTAPLTGGVYKVTAATVEYPTVKDTAEVRVREPILRFNPSVMELNPGQQVQLGLTFEGRGNSEHFVGGGTVMTTMANGLKPTGEMRC